MEALNAHIVGISYDSPDANRAWAERMSFDFPLLSDPGREVADLLEVRRPPPHPMSAFPRRVTYLIDPEGMVARSFDVGRHIKGHAEEVFEALHSLAGRT